MAVRMCPKCQRRFEHYYLTCPRCKKPMYLQLDLFESNETKKKKYVTRHSSYYSDSFTCDDPEKD